MTRLVLHGGRRSPFVRRIAIWLGLQGRQFTRRPAEIFGSDFEVFRAFNPLSRVPVLSVDDELNLIETAAIVDYLEDTAEPDKRLIPQTGEGRLGCQQRIALANALAEKGVAYVYETERRPEAYQWEDWIARLTVQIEAGLLALDALAPPDGWMGGEAPDGSDVAALAAYDFVSGLTAFEGVDCPRLAALSERAKTVPVFAETHPKAA